MLFIKNEEILKILEWKGLLAYVEKGLEEISTYKGSTVPARTIISTPGLTFYTMPAYSHFNKVVTCKLITQCPENEEKYNIPSISGAIVAFSAETGRLEAVLDAEVLTEWRTAAGSLAAAKYLWPQGRDGGDGKVLAVLGAGKQGKAHIEAFQALYKFTTVNLWNRTIQRAENLARELTEKGIAINVIPDPNTCVQEADIIIWAGSAAEVYLTSGDIRKGTFIISVGTSPAMPSGLSAEIFQKAQLFTESVAAARSEMKTFIEENNLEFSEIGGVISGSGVEFRNSDNFIVYQSLGSGMMDAAAVKFILENYKKETGSF